MTIGLFWLNSLKETENQLVYVRNPHELARYTEVQSRLVVAEMYFQACLKRLEHHGEKYFQKMRSPWEPAHWESLQVQKKIEGEVITEYWPPYYELEAPYSASYQENFYRFNPDYDEKYKAKEDEQWKNLMQY